MKIYNPTNVDLDDAALIKQILISKNADKFRQLYYDGDWSGSAYGSQSEADLGLCNILAFWTGKNSVQMDRLFRRSKLFRAEKWDSVRVRGQTYGAATIDKAIAASTDIYGAADTKESIILSSPPAPIPFESYVPSSIPPEVAPGILREFSCALAESIQVPFELVLANVLGTIAVAAQRKFRVHVKEGYREGLNIYILCPLPPGERKSSTVEACKRPLVEWQQQVCAKNLALIKLVESERKTLEKTIEHKRQDAAKAETPEGRNKLIEEIKKMEAELPKIPPPPRLLADDFTPEALGMLMATYDERIGLLEAEGGLFDTLAGRYSNGVPNLDAVLKFWSGEACHIDRRGRESIFLRNPHLTLCISPQPEVVQKLSSNPVFRGRGLIGRFLYFIAQSRLGHRSIETAPIPYDTEKAWERVVNHLLNLPWALDEHNEKIPYTIQLEPAAYGLWKLFAEKIEEKLRPGGEFEHMTDWAGKFPGQAIRIAGLFHVATVEKPHSTLLSGDTMQNALNLALILADHAKAAFTLMGTDSSQECAKAILRWILRDRVERFSARDAFEKVKGRFQKMEQIRFGLSLLEERFFIFPVAETCQGPGRKPSPNYTVNPHLWEANHVVC